ncbi:hypothetical protein F9C07_2125923 [Aspergillus flavus]|uniref:Uncharacterized protein n=1 Tax=Aspergillus flavus (strain ATCC 200026 / FGSC A1120 / IAM 13836 / NRRL 3357 / JCM 12722 / SRRC 167) TaxID=332952 RepID=A0A7U2QR43_ASPFN|nr:hypothetical protein AFLA_012455 [Aspergillus flavus NRRL3357]QRD81508.1 hypothetical protein F9C07_2125923 [Aspergillus flavus]
MYLIDNHRIPQYDAILRGLRFPRLSLLYLDVERSHKERQDWQCHIPRLGSHRISVLLFDYRCGMEFGLTPHEMDQVIDQIPDTFPQLEYMSFKSRPKVNKGAFKRLNGQLPRLGCIDHPDWWGKTD